MKREEKRRRAKEKLCSKWYVITPRKHNKTQVFRWWWPFCVFGRYFSSAVLHPLSWGSSSYSSLFYMLCAPWNMKADASSTVLSQCSFHDDDQMMHVWEMKRKLMKTIQGRIQTTWKAIQYHPHDTLLCNKCLFFFFYLSLFLSMNAMSWI